MGKKAKAITEGAGTEISGGNAVEVNFDFATMSKWDAVKLLDQIKKRIRRGPWPPA
jgi:hypothetical protein